MVAQQERYNFTLYKVRINVSPPTEFGVSSYTHWRDTETLGLIEGGKGGLQARSDRPVKPVFLMESRDYTYRMETERGYGEKRETTINESYRVLGHEAVEAGDQTFKDAIKDSLGMPGYKRARMGLVYSDGRELRQDTGPGEDAAAESDNRCLSPETLRGDKALSEAVMLPIVIDGRVARHGADGFLL